MTNRDADGDDEAMPISVCVSYCDLHCNQIVSSTAYYCCLFRCTPNGWKRIHYIIARYVTVDWFGNKRAKGSYLWVSWKRIQFCAKMILQPAELRAVVEFGWWQSLNYMYYCRHCWWLLIRCPLIFMSSFLPNIVTMWDS